jgi:hypothetical protein
VLAANHSETSWKGQINIRSATDDYRQCVELLSGREMPFIRDSVNTIDCGGSAGLRCRHLTLGIS